MVHDSEATLGRTMWHMLHIIAANFPNKGEGLTLRRLRGYYDFFKSLQHVLPRESWRYSWRMATGVSDAMTWKSFQALRSNKKLSYWLFSLHDEIRKSMHQPMHGPSDPAKRYAQFYKQYASYRTGKNGRRNVNATDANGTQKIKDMLVRRVSAMNKFMAQKYPQYASWTVARKHRMRMQDIDEAAQWYWSKTQTELSKNASWNSKNALKQTKEIVDKFDNDHRRGRARLINMKNAPARYFRDIFGIA